MASVCLRVCVIVCMRVYVSCSDLRGQEFASNKDKNIKERSDWNVHRNVKRLSKGMLSL